MKRVADYFASDKNALCRRLFQKENLLTAERIYVNGVSVTMNSKEIIAPVSISPLSEIARVLVCFNHVARIIVNADHGIM